MNKIVLLGVSVDCNSNKRLVKMNVSIIGFGWLGKALFDELKQRKIDVNVFSRNTLKDHQVIEYNIGDDISPKLLDSNLIFVLIPPRLRNSDESALIESHKKFFNQLSKDTKVIYTSSTSVYIDNGICTEESKCDGSLWEIENIIRNRFKEHLILRLGGLAGPNRIIVNMLQKKGLIENWDSPTNLVHLIDVINILILGFENNIIGTYNVCSDEHPIKYKVYNYWNQKFNLKLLPKGETSKKYKIIDNKLWKTIAKYKYNFPNPLEYTF